MLYSAYIINTSFAGLISAAHQTLLRWAIMVGNANIMDAPAPGGLGGTYAGNPLAVAAAHAVLNIIDKESLCERANQLGQRLKNTLIDAKESVPAIAAVRGLGSMIAAEFNDPQTGEPST